METLKEGAIVKGIVKNITDYGAFVDLGGIDGLLHITDLAWRRVQPSVRSADGGRRNHGQDPEVRPGEEPRFPGHQATGRRSVDGLGRRYPQGTRLFGKVTNLTDYGAFVEIEQGIEGLVHVSEMDWTNKNVHPSKVVAAGRRSRSHDPGDRRGTPPHFPGHEAVQANPWDDFAINHKKGDKVKGQIKSITDFGVFIGLAGGIDGLVHLSDLSWTDARRRSRAQLQEGR